MWIPTNQIRQQHLLLRYQPLLRQGRSVQLLQPRMVMMCIAGVGSCFVIVALICALSFARYRELRVGHECYLMQEWQIWLPLSLVYMHAIAISHDD